MEDFYINPLIQKLNMLKSDFSKMNNESIDLITSAIFKLNNNIDLAYSIFFKNKNIKIYEVDAKDFSSNEPLEEEGDGLPLLLNAKREQKLNEVEDEFRKKMAEDGFIMEKIKEKDLFDKIAENNIKIEDNEIKNESDDEYSDSEAPSSQTPGNDFKRYKETENPNYHVENFFDRDDSVKTKIKKLLKIKSKSCGLNNYPLTKTQRVKRNKIINNYIKKLDPSYTPK